MPYKICENCGAHLDSFEHCDCKERKKEASPKSDTGLTSTPYNTDDTTFKAWCQDLISMCERGQP